MVNSLSTSPAPPIHLSSSSSSTKKTTTLRFRHVGACHTDSRPVLIDRRTVSLGFAGVSVGLIAVDWSANAARRPPQPPPTEKPDPNVSGVRAKVLASKKRKEAMKESIAKLREKGKPINSKPTQPSSAAEAEPSQ